MFSLKFVKAASTFGNAGVQVSVRFDNPHNPDDFGRYCEWMSFEMMITGLIECLGFTHTRASNVRQKIERAGEWTLENMGTTTQELVLCGLLMPDDERVYSRYEG
jgi:hypothetical protein